MRPWIFAFVLFIVAAICRAAGPATQPADHLNLIAFGDWGEKSPHRQLMANTMAKFVSASTQPYDAALGLGDNFYVPIHGVDDPIFQSFFEQTYDPKILSFPFYFCLGNHDYDATGGVARWQWEIRYPLAHPNSRWKMPARWYRIDLPEGHPLATILMLDSDKENAGTSGSLTSAEWVAELKWMQSELAAPHAPWVICCAHHPLYSNGIHGDNGVLIDTWGLLFAKYHVDFFLCGHDHSLQHLEIPSVATSFVISGGGGAKNYVMLRDDRGPFSRAIPGFAALRLTPQSATVDLVSMDGALLHEFARTTAGQVTVLQTTASEKRTNEPLRYIQGYGDRPGAQP